MLFVVTAAPHYTVSISSSSHNLRKHRSHNLWVVTGRYSSPNLQQLPVLKRVVQNVLIDGAAIRRFAPMNEDQENERDTAVRDDAGVSSRCRIGIGSGTCLKPAFFRRSRY